MYEAERVNPECKKRLIDETAKNMDLGAPDELNTLNAGSRCCLDTGPYEQ